MVLSFANEKGSKLDMKKLWSIIIIAVILLALAIGTWAAYSAGYIGVNRNAKILRSMVREFSRTISGTGAKVVETKSVYGKLNGNRERHKLFRRGIGPYRFGQGYRPADRRT